MVDIIPSWGSQLLIIGASNKYVLGPMVGIILSYGAPLEIFSARNEKKNNLISFLYFVSQENRTMENKVLHLLHAIQRKGQDALTELLQILDKTGQGHITDTLKQNLPEK